MNSCPTILGFSGWGSIPPLFWGSLGGDPPPHCSGVLRAGIHPPRSGVLRAGIVSPWSCSRRNPQFGSWCLGKSVSSSGCVSCLVLCLPDADLGLLRPCLPGYHPRMSVPVDPFVHGPFSASRPHPSMEPLECRQRWAQVTLQPSTGTDTDLTSDSLLSGGGLAKSLLSLLQVYRMPHDVTRVLCGTRAVSSGAVPPWRLL